MNSVNVIGNLGMDPEPLGDTGCRMRVAVNEYWKDKNGEFQEKTNWMSVKAWGYAAEKCLKLSKGMPVAVTGSLQVDDYEKDGEKKTATYIKAMQVKSLQKREDNGSAEALPF